MTSNFDPLSYFPEGAGMLYAPETGALTYYLRGHELKIGHPIWVKSLNQLGVIVSDCACNTGTMFDYMTSTITTNPTNYLFPGEHGYGAQA